MFFGKSENKFINKIHKHTLRLIYDAENATLEDLLERENLRTILEVHKSPNNMEFFRLQEK